jgi:hypothetical protein
MLEHTQLRRQQALIRLDPIRLVGAHPISIR